MGRQIWHLVLLIAVVGCTTWTLAVTKRAEIPSTWLEDDAESRARFKEIQEQPAPKLEVTNWMNGQAMTVQSLKGKVVLLDFWGTWCPPCIAQIPHINELSEKYRDRGLVVIGVCHSDGAETMGDVVKEKGMKYPAAADVDLKTNEAYRVADWPQFYLIDREGKLRICSVAEDKIEEAIKALLEEAGDEGPRK